MAGEQAPERTLLVVASDLMWQSRLAEGLRALGYHVALADTAEEALEALASGVALVIVDLQGAVPWEGVVRAAKERATPVVAYGQHTKPELLRSARKAGADVVVPRSTLVEGLGEVIGRAQQIEGRGPGVGR